MTRQVFAGGLLSIVLVVTAFIALKWQLGRADRILVDSLGQRVPFPVAGVRVCTGEAGNPAVLLVLGQSNAGNHGAEDEKSPMHEPATATVSNGVNCIDTGDPLPGATGRHRSIWTQLRAQLRTRGYARELVFVPIAVEATTIDDWTRETSPLRQLLQTALADISRTRLKIDAVLWQQGEADARVGTSARDYALRLQQLVLLLRASGVEAPILLARSTRCGASKGAAEVRAAVAGLTQGRTDLLLGPDTDELGADLRIDGCHFTRAGLAAAAALWAEALTPVLP